MQSDFRHFALLYMSEDEFLAGTLPFLHEGLAAGEAILVAVDRGKTALLEGALGPDAGEISFADMESLGRNPARIIPFWRGFVDQHQGGPVRGIGEPIWPGRRAAEIDECQRHEALLDLAFGADSAWSLLCPYDAAVLPEEVLAAVATAHHHLVRGGVAEPGLGPLAGDHVFAGALSPCEEEAESLQFDRGGLAAVRRQVEALAKGAGLASMHVYDLVVAASELATNSVSHGGGAGTLRTWAEDDRVLVQVEDRGRIADPLVGRIRPTITQQAGRGLWLVNQLCDLTQIRSGPSGTTVRVHLATV